MEGISKGREGRRRGKVGQNFVIEGEGRRETLRTNEPTKGEGTYYRTLSSQPIEARALALEPLQGQLIALSSFPPFTGHLPWIRGHMTWSRLRLLVY